MFKLGKQEYKHDVRTLAMARFLLPEIFVPKTYDFDKNRAQFPVSAWGNNDWGNCVIAGEANQLLRLERVEQRRTITLRPQDVVERYKTMTGARSPGDNNDTGLVILDAMRNWKNSGWVINNRNYKIEAYGELEPNDPQQLRMAIYGLRGIHLGFWLPSAAQEMTRRGVWDYTGESGPEWEPGSWGGHLVYSKAFVRGSLEILTWGMKVRVTDDFISKYSDEAWAVVDALDSWRVKQTVNVSALVQELQQISGHVNT